MKKRTMVIPFAISGLMLLLSGCAMTYEATEDVTVSEYPDEPNVGMYIKKRPDIYSSVYLSGSDARYLGTYNVRYLKRTRYLCHRDFFGNLPMGCRPLYPRSFYYDSYRGGYRGGYLVVQ